MTHLRTLTDAELSRHADNALDPLTSTDLERELLRRWEEYAWSGPLLDILEDNGVGEPEVLGTLLADGQRVADFSKGCENGLFDTLEAHEIDGAEDLRQRLLLADVLREFDIEDPEKLRKQLDRTTELDQALQDLAEPIKSLLTLATTEE